jgi:hypothetical protein
VLVAVLATVAGALWFVVELRRVTRIDEQWQVADAASPLRDALRANSRPAIQ